MNKRIIAIILFAQIFSTYFVTVAYGNDILMGEGIVDFYTDVILNSWDTKVDESVVEAVYHNPFELKTTSITYIDKISMNEPELCYFYQMGSSAELLSLPDTAYAIFNRFDHVMCEINWRYDHLEKLMPGRHLFLGDVVLPEGYAFEDEILTASVPLIVYDSQSEPTEKIENCIFTGEAPNIVIPLGTAEDDLPQYFEHFEQEAFLITEKGDYFLCSLSLNYDLIDTHKEGIYYPIILDLPGGVTFDGQESYFLSVHVIPRDKVVLDSWRYFQFSYYIKWLYPAKDPILWTSINNEEWYEVEIHPDHSLSNTYGNFLSEDETEGVNVLELLFNFLPSGHLYKFQVQYDTTEFSNILILDLINNSPPRFSNEAGGSRTGVDREENTLPNYHDHNHDYDNYHDHDNTYLPAPTPADLQDENTTFTLPNIKWDIHRFNYIPFAAVNSAIGHLEEEESLTVSAEQIEETEDLSNIPMGSMDVIHLPMESNDTEDIEAISLSYGIAETSIKKEILPRETKENIEILSVDTSMGTHSETDATSLKDDDIQDHMDIDNRDSWGPTILAGIIGLTITVAFLILMNKKWRRE